MSLWVLINAIKSKSQTIAINKGKNIFFSNISTSSKKMNNKVSILNVFTRVFVIYFEFFAGFKVMHLSRNHKQLLLTEENF
jgi:hypothetical protein